MKSVSDPFSSPQRKIVAPGPQSVWPTATTLETPKRHPQCPTPASDVSGIGIAEWRFRFVEFESRRANY
jgi:hypothetical protein